MYTVTKEIAGVYSDTKKCNNSFLICAVYSMIQMGEDNTTVKAVHRTNMLVSQFGG